jgi:hypothetical protein
LLVRDDVLLFRADLMFFRADVLSFRVDLRLGTFAPLLRASFSPIAIACLRLFTERPEPLFSVPLFRRRIADFTVFDAALPYFAISASRCAGAAHPQARREPS